ncbi:MAG: hypothetical protein JWM76_4217 [Pseudonocardiales bacterium]|nr:hypothetical protein [Pseudonocardiales bacterium]
MTRPVRIAVTTVALAASTLGLVACGGKSGSSTASTTSAAASASGSASASNGGRAGGRFGEIYSDPKVQACLKAAGITVPTAAARPSGSFTGTRPSNFPSGERPSNFPSGARPSGAGAGGGFGNSAESEKIQAALKACGITLPTRTGQPTGTAQPTANPSGAPAS